MPEPGYRARDVCSVEGDAGGRGGGPGGGGGFGGFGGGANAGPWVLPGTYQVALVVNGSVVESKPLDIVMDGEVRMTIAEHTRYNAILSDLHETQRRATPIVAAFNAIHPQMTDIAGRIGDMASVPADAKSAFEALNRDYEAQRVKFGVPTPTPAGGGRGRGGGFGGFGAPDPTNLVARIGAVKASIMSFWEPPSTALVRQYEEVTPALARAITDAQALLARAATVAQTLGRHGLTLTVPSTR